MQWLLLLGSTALGCAWASIVVACKLSCPKGCGILFPSPGIEPVSPDSQADSKPLDHQGRPYRVGNGLPFPSPGDLPNPGIKPASPALAGRFFTTEPSVHLWQGPAFRRCHIFPRGSQLCPPQFQAICISSSSEFQRNNWSCYPSEGVIIGPPKGQSPGRLEFSFGGYKTRKGAVFQITLRSCCWK